METATVTMATLPLNQKVHGHTIVLHYLGPRKRKAERKCFDGVTKEECMSEVKAFLSSAGGKVVPQERYQSPYGRWEGVTFERVFCETTKGYAIWASSYLFQDAVSVTEEEFKEIAQ